ncbi:MAG: IscA/HesB family protein [Proteobacteria bacterium]|nr:IscA/HesB family protein [Pseudomonadota bacterium]MBU1057741.1 IscA/HesB family protein [Pseudomonadota bacterium]
MLEVTESALVNLKDFLAEQKKDSTVRIAMKSGGCAGPALELAMDKVRENDNIFDHDGVSFVVDKKLIVICGAITVNFIEEYDDRDGYGGGGTFAVTSENYISSRNGSCSCGFRSSGE